MWKEYFFDAIYLSMIQFDDQIESTNQHWLGNSTLQPLSWLLRLFYSFMFFKLEVNKKGFLGPSKPQ